MVASTLIINAVYLAWADTKARYKKSVLGPFWIVLTNLIGVIGLSVVWAQLFNQDIRQFAPTLAIGLIVWQLIAGVLGVAPGAFCREHHMIRNVALPIWFFAMRLLARHVINFAHNLVIVAGVVWYFDLPLSASTLMVVPALVLVIANLFWVIGLLGMLGARFRDIELAVQSVLPLLFFISPVMLRADRLSAGEAPIWGNPLSYFIEAVRAPLLGHVTHAHAFTVLLALLLCGGLLTWLLIRAQGRRVAFWV